MNTTSTLYTGSYKIFRSYGGKCLNSILAYLYCAKYNEINVRHSYIHKNVFHKKWHKYYKYFVYRVTQKFPDPMREIFKEYFIIFILHEL